MMAAKKQKSVAAKRRERKLISADLLAQLERIGTVGATASDLVERYLCERDQVVDADERIAFGGMDDADAAKLIEMRTQSTTAMAAILDVLSISPATARRAKLEADIMSQLKSNGLDKSEIYLDKMRQFLLLWDQNREAHRCLRAKGRTYFTISSAGKSYEKDNQAAKDITAYPRAMDDILDSMGVTLKNYAGEDEDDEL